MTVAARVVKTDGAERVVPMHPRHAEILKGASATGAGGRLFTANNGERLGDWRKTLEWPCAVIISPGKREGTPMTAQNQGGFFKWHADEYGVFAGKAYGEAAQAEASGNCAHCPWCGAELEDEVKVFDVFPSGRRDARLDQCLACGWYREVCWNYSYQAHIVYSTFGRRVLLREFNVTDNLVTLAEIGTYLKQNFSDVYSLPWRRFEELVDDIFKNRGFQTQLTQPSRDGGADVILLNGEGGRLALVEVKKYAKDHSVGVALVRQLAGVQLATEVRKGYFVTTSTFTRGAREFAELVAGGKSGFEVELWDALRVLKELDCYDEAILPLNAIDPGRPLHQQLPRTAPRRVLRDLARVSEGEPLSIPQPG